MTDVANLTAVDRARAALDRHAWTEAYDLLAAEDGVSLNQWINVAVAQKIGAMETVERLRERYGEARPDDLRSILAKVPDVPPMPGDELPDDLKGIFGQGRVGADP